jgi:ComF family protein
MNILQNILSPFSEFGKSVLDVIYPELCGFCNKRLEEHELLYCDKCKARIPRNYMNTLSSIKQKLHRKQYYQYIAWSFGYNDIMKMLIHDFKFNSYPVLYKFIAPEMLKTLLSKNDLSSADCIIPVPLHKARYRIRGYNQSKLLADHISEKTGIQLDLNLIRVRNTRPQSRLENRVEKLENVKGAFAVPDETRIKEKSVILVDDIVTSGATVNECAKELKKAGAGNIYVLTAVRSK